MEFCCCWLPLVNVGAYLLVLETALVALAVGICALAPPTIVATKGAIPSWSKDLVAALGFVTLVWQIIGLVSVARQTPTLYHVYVRINLVLTLCIIVAAVAFLVTSGVKRSSVVQTCISTYGVSLPASGSSGTSISGFTESAFQAAGYDICNIFVWVQTGVMAGLIVLMALTQFYMLFAQRAYGKDQREAFRSTKSYQDIPMNPRDSGVWEPRDDAAYNTRANDHDYHNSASDPSYDAYGDQDRFDHHQPYQYQHATNEHRY